MTDICRLCANETHETNLINLSICTEKILQCCQINLEEEHLPQNVCNICLDNVEVNIIINFTSLHYLVDRLCFFC